MLPLMNGSSIPLTMELLNGVPFILAHATILHLLLMSLLNTQGRCECVPAGGLGMLQRMEGRPQSLPD